VVITLKRSQDRRIIRSVYFPLTVIEHLDRKGEEYGLSANKFINLIITHGLNNDEFLNAVVKGKKATNLTPAPTPVVEEPTPEPVVNEGDEFDG